MADPWSPQPGLIARPGQLGLIAGREGWYRGKEGCHRRKEAWYRGKEAWDQSQTSGQLRTLTLLGREVTLDLLKQVVAGKAERRGGSSSGWSPSSPDVIPSIPMVGLEKLNINKNPPWGRDVLCVILPTKLLVNFTLRRLPDAEITEDTDYDQWSLTSANQRYDESPCLVLEDGLSQTVSRSTTAWLKPDAKIFLREKKGGVIAPDTPHLGFRAVFEAAPEPPSPTELRTGVQQPGAAPASRSSSSSSSSSVPSRTTEGLPLRAVLVALRRAMLPAPPAAVTAPSGVDEEWFQAVMAAFDNAPRPGGKKKRKLAEADVVDLVDSDDDEGDSPPSPPAAVTNDDDDESAYLDLQCAVCQVASGSLQTCCGLVAVVSFSVTCTTQTRVEAIRPNLGISNLIEALSAKKKILGELEVLIHGLRPARRVELLFLHTRLLAPGHVSSLTRQQPSAACKTPICNLPTARSECQPIVWLEDRININMMMMYVKSSSI
ncbi:hypothetical protein FOZ60_016732 [Perkinsus olseni]|uniref:Uncharacterized protein n=1 Tax=Perkinsus olseni TaxID=32597 RepID=A0A7J6P4X0_PEROL|nr:hypothetical protein FOZ60_016732 [Perkinsus olseni]